MQHEESMHGKSQTSFWMVVVGVLGSACVGAADVESSVSPGEPVWQSANPVLADSFGKVLTIRARVATDWVDGDRDPILLVEQVDGQPVGEPTSIWWSYGGWHAERAAASGWQGLSLVPGCWYELRGYEAGSWRGIVDLTAAGRGSHTGSGFDDFGPLVPGGYGFGFRSVFRVVAGRLLKSGDLGEPDPYGLSPRK